MNTMSYKQYLARIEYSDEDECFVGHIAGISDIIGFHGDTVVALKKAFQHAVNDYIDSCKKIGRLPQKPYSGKILLRLTPEIHAKAAMLAEANGKSLNSWVQNIIMQANHEDPRAS